MLVHLPTFPRYELEARLHGCHVVAVESTPPWAIDIESLRTALANHRIALAFLCTPNNPTGAIIAPDEVRELARAFPETLFIVDEALCNPLDSAAVPLVQTEPNVVVLRTFSKSFGLAGLRIGYALGAARSLQIAELGRPPFNVGTAGEAAAVAALDDHGFLESCYATFHVEAAAFIERSREAAWLSLAGSVRQYAADRAYPAFGNGLHRCAGGKGPAGGGRRVLRRPRRARYDPRFPP